MTPSTKITFEQPWSARTKGSRLTRLFSSTFSRAYTRSSTIRLQHGVYRGDVREHRCTKKGAAPEAKETRGRWLEEEGKKRRKRTCGWTKVNRREGFFAFSSRCYSTRSSKLEGGGRGASERARERIRERERERERESRYVRKARG